MSVIQPEIRNWTIYRITNPQGRIYIGKTVNFKKRMNSYSGSHTGAKRQPILLKSLIKYGFINHKIDVLDTFIGSCDFASGKEIFWIRSFMSNIKKWKDGNGMNLTEGGDGALGREVSEETKERIREKNKGMIVSEERRRIASETHKGKQHRLGKKVSVESLKKWEKIKGRKLNPERVSIRTKKLIDVIGRPIIQSLSNGEFVAEYATATELIKTTGLSKTQFYKYLRGERGALNGFIFKYKNN